MSKTIVKRKRLDVPSNSRVNGWILLAEDAERQAENARERSTQLTQAARIFRQNSESGTPFPQSAGHQTEQQHSV